MPVDPTLPDEPTPADNPAASNPPSSGLPTDTPATNTFDPAAILSQLFGQQAKPVDPEVRSADALYMQLWGVAPPKGYIEGLVHQGLNLYEIAANEMAKPAYASTKSYEDSWSSYAQQVAQVFGRR